MAATTYRMSGSGSSSSDGAVSGGSAAAAANPNTSTSIGTSSYASAINGATRSSVASHSTSSSQNSSGAGPSSSTGPNTSTSNRDSFNTSIGISGGGPGSGRRGSHPDRDGGSSSSSGHTRASSSSTSAHSGSSSISKDAPGVRSSNGSTNGIGGGLGLGLKKATTTSAADSSTDAYVSAPSDLPEAEEGEEEDELLYNEEEGGDSLSALRQGDAAASRAGGGGGGGAAGKARVVGRSGKARTKRAIPSLDGALPGLGALPRSEGEVIASSSASASSGSGSSPAPNHNSNSSSSSSSTSSAKQIPRRPAPRIAAAISGLSSSPGISSASPAAAVVSSTNAAASSPALSTLSLASSGSSPVSSPTMGPAVLAPTTGAAAAPGAGAGALNGKPRRKLQPSIPSRKGSAPLDASGAKANGAGGVASAQSILNAVNAYREAQAKHNQTPPSQQEQKQQTPAASVAPVLASGLASPAPAADPTAEADSATPIASRFARTSDWAAPSAGSASKAAEASSGAESGAAAEASTGTRSNTHARIQSDEDTSRFSVLSGLSDLVDFSNVVERLNEGERKRAAEAQSTSLSAEPSRKISMDGDGSPNPGARTETGLLRPPSSVGSTKTDIDGTIGSKSRTNSFGSTVAGDVEAEVEGVQVMTATKVARPSAASVAAVSPGFNRGSVTRKPPPLREASEGSGSSKEATTTTVSASNSGSLTTSDSMKSFVSNSSSTSSSTGSKTPTTPGRRKGPPSALQLQQTTSDAFRKDAPSDASAPAPAAAPASPTRDGNNLDVKDRDALVQAALASPRSSMAQQPPTGPPAEPLPPVPRTPGGTRLPVPKSGVPTLPPPSPAVETPRVAIQPDTPGRRAMSLSVVSPVNSSTDAPQVRRATTTGGNNVSELGRGLPGLPAPTSTDRSSTQARPQATGAHMRSVSAGRDVSPITPRSKGPPPVSPSGHFAAAAQPLEQSASPALASTGRLLADEHYRSASGGIERTRSDSVMSHGSTTSFLTNRRAEMEQDRSVTANRGDVLRRAEGRFTGAFGGGSSSEREYTPSITS